jgi:predicted house-cleaning noncanonical NTP pyrophosphatase (MazG superfamily)
MPGSDKLLRDRIPDLIRQAGGTCEVEMLSPEDYRQALRRKLVEEAQEAAAAPPADLVAELADLAEVLDALLVAAGIAPATLRAVQEQRRLERGGFTRRLRLRDHTRERQA